MSARHTLFAGVIAAAALAGACAHLPEAAPAASAVSDAPFAQLDQTIAYHFMIQVAALSEADLGSSFQARIVEPLEAVADVGALGNCKPCGYVDSKERGLWKHNLIVRVRDGQVTIKARAFSPALLLDLSSCASKKYEMDYFGAPEYSISSDIKFSSDECDIGLPMSATAPLWDCIKRECPDAWRQIRPAVTSSAGLRIPGVAHMYSAEATLNRANETKLKESSVAVWFFPPTDKFLVELAFTAFAKDRLGADSLYAQVGRTLREAGLLSADPASKTQQYFAAYFGTGNRGR